MVTNIDPKMSHEVQKIPRNYMGSHQLELLCQVSQGLLQVLSLFFGPSKFQVVARPTAVAMVASETASPNPNQLLHLSP